MQKKPTGRRRSWTIVILFFIAGIFISGIWTGVRIYKIAERKGCFPLPENLHPITIDVPYEKFRFVALGDTGSGTEDQRLVAAAAKSYCQEAGCSFGLLLGDNFYENGLVSLDDPTFQKLFVEVYQDLKIPFFAVLGNHDVRGSIYAQLFHALDTPQWKMPNLVYGFNAGPAKFVGYNSNCSPFYAQDVTELSAGDAPWKFVFAHHGIYSSGTHGDQFYPIRLAWKYLFKDRFDFYLSGHDHELEHLTLPNDQTDYVVSGAGGKNYRDPSEQSRTKPSVAESHFIHSDSGFVAFTVEPDRVEVQYIDLNGKILYQFTKKKS